LRGDIVTTPASAPDLESVRDEAVTRWEAILRATDRTPAEQARVQAAYELADATLHAAVRDRVPTRFADPARQAFHNDRTWHRIALMWHQVLTDTQAFARARGSDATACRFDPTAARAWLTGPHPDGDGSVADVLGIGDDFDLSGFHKWPRITQLIAAAQTANVFGVADHTVSVLHLAGDHGYVDRHRITLTTPHHGVLCSDDLDTADLLTDHLSGVDAAVHLLEQAAQTADRLLYQRALLADVAWPAPAQGRDREPTAASTTRTGPQPRPGKAFRPLAEDNPATTPPQTPAPATNPPATRRRR
jgi:hypothetical protein